MDGQHQGVNALRGLRPIVSANRHGVGPHQSRYQGCRCRQPRQGRKETTGDEGDRSMRLGLRELPSSADSESGRRDLNPNLTAPNGVRCQITPPPNAARGSRTRNLSLLKRTPLPVGLERQAKFSAWLGARGGIRQRGPAICRSSCHAPSASGRGHQRRCPSRASGDAWRDRASPSGGRQTFERTRRRLAPRAKTLAEAEQRVDEFDHSCSSGGPLSLWTTR